MYADKASVIAELASWKINLVLYIWKIERLYEGKTKPFIEKS